MKKDPHRYDDMLHLPHHQSRNHPPMTRYNRAAQFSPFAALTGYEQSIAETARLTDRKIELDENAIALLDEKLLTIVEHIHDHQEFTFTYFVPDSVKSGGSYRSETGIVKKINLSERKIVLYANTTDLQSFSPYTADGTVINIDQIIDIR